MNKILTSQNEENSINTEPLANPLKDPSELTYPHAALLAISEILDLQGGVLTPLGRVLRPTAPSDRVGLMALLEAQPKSFGLAMQSLIDPQMSLALFLGDGDTALVGQYLWPDAEGCGPCFKVVAEELALRLSGPIRTEDVEQVLFDLFPLSGIAEPKPVTLELKTGQFWAVLCLLDAYRITLLQRRLARAGGMPHGISPETLQQACTLGLGIQDPGWAVSLFTMLLPDQVPPQLEASLPAVMKSLCDDELLYFLEAGKDDSYGNWYVLGEGLDAFCRGITGNPAYIGLALQRVISPGLVGTTVIGGWRTPGGVWLADVSDIASGQVELRCEGPGFFTHFIETLLLPEDKGSGKFVPDARYSTETMLAALKQAQKTPHSRSRESQPLPSSTVAVTCSSCGNPLKPGLKFCGKCGATAAKSVTCPGCGKPLKPDTRFCGSCGFKVQS
jgi:hypothetical protein